MASSAVVRSGRLFRTALRGPSRTSAPPNRNFSSSAHTDELYEAAEASKWEKITYLGIVSCSILAMYTLLKGHPHHDEAPPYPYLHIRNKEFPWSIHFCRDSRINCSDGLFETKRN